jgi:four helix bundle protein
MHNYKNLKIWLEAMDLVTEIYSITSDFPDTEKYGLINQLRRASISIPSNIAEGTSRPSQKEFKHFLHIALGSSFEVTTQIELSFRLNFITEEIRNHLLDINDLLQRKIQSFLKQLN